jgi:hypothetical protein
VEGYRGALGRLVEAVGDPEASAEQTFIPLFEALNWAASIDMFFVANQKPIQDDLLTAVRFARNRVHHQWGLALSRYDSPGVPMIHLATSRSRHYGPPPGFWWQWVKLSQLPVWTPSVSAPRGEDQYRDELAERSTEATLKALLPVLEALI